MAANGIKEPSPFVSGMREKFASFLTGQLQTVLAPIEEYVPHGRKLSAAAALLACSAAMWGLPKSAPAAEPDPIRSSGVAAGMTAEPSVGEQEIVTPARTSEMSPVNEACGDPGYKAPEAVQIASMLCRFNNARSTPLVHDPEMDAAAEAKLDDIIKHRTFSHWPNPESEDALVHTKEIKGTEPVWFMGENLARGEGVLGKARATFGAWRRSPTHWANIVNGDYTNVGFAIEHYDRIVLDVDIGGLIMGNMVNQDVTIWVAEFYGQNET